MKSIKTLLIGIIGYFLVGSLFLGMSMNNIEAKTGIVWSKIERGTELLPRVESLVQSEMKERRDILTQLVEGRQGIADARSQNDIEGALKSLQTAQQGFNLLVEDNSISSGLNDLQRDLITTTEGTFNRISYSRDELILAQSGYNSTRLLFVLNQPFTSKVEVLGSQSSPTRAVPPSQFE